MKALVFNGPRDIRYEGFKDPERTIDNAVILKVNKCSICGSDLHIYHGDVIGQTDYGKDAEHFCVGHEFIGEVVDVGPHAFGYQVGDKVLAAGGTGCGTCSACRTGKAERCRASTAFGIGPSLQGGQAEFVVVPNADRTLSKIPDGVSDEQAILLTDALATAYFGITRSEVKPGGTVVIVGLGPIGLLAVELAFVLGAATVFAVDPVAARRQQATSLGAQALAPGEEAFATVMAATHGLGAESVFEASGAPKAIESVLGFTRPGGTASFIGLPQMGASLPLAKILYKNVTVRGGICPVTEMWPALIPLLQEGRIKGEGLFSHHMHLSDGAEAYRLFDSKEDGVLKILMTVT